MNIYTLFFISSEIMSYVVRMAVFSGLKVTVQYVRDLPFLWIICALSLLQGWHSLGFPTLSL